jgi:hypothetical protein
MDRQRIAAFSASRGIAAPGENTPKLFFYIETKLQKEARTHMTRQRTQDSGHARIPSTVRANLANSPP